MFRDLLQHAQGDFIDACCLKHGVLLEMADAWYSPR